MNKIPVAVLGATGSVGQRFVELLENHPWFEVTCVAASKKSAGKPYGTVMRDRWILRSHIPAGVRNLTVLSVEDDAANIAKTAAVAFCALDMEKPDILRIEDRYASLGVAVISNNSANRWTDDVPMIMPEINPQHAALIRSQREKRGWKSGLIAVKPNCSIQSYVSVLTALKKFGPKKVRVVSLQSISGAGKTFDTWPEMRDNVIPFIGGEEEKSEQEPLKIWGRLDGGRIRTARTPEIAATCIRVPTTDGHMAAVSVSFVKKPTEQEILRAVTSYACPIQDLHLPSAPRQFITYYPEADRPQTRLDRDMSGGMGISMGRLRSDKFYNWQFISLAHNIVRGAAGGAILMAELLVKKNYIRH